MPRVGEEHPVAEVAATRDRPQRGWAIEATIDPRAAVAGEPTGPRACPGGTVGPDQLPDTVRGSAHTPGTAAMARL